MTADHLLGLSFCDLGVDLLNLPLYPEYLVLREARGLHFFVGFKDVRIKSPR